MFDIPCVILAGGKSSRMGRDKSLLPFKGFKTLSEYQYTKLSKIFKNVYISSKSDKFEMPNTKLLLESSTIYSPMVALKSIFESLDDEKIFIITVDTPLVSEESIRKIIDFSLDYDIVVAQDEEKIHNLCGVFSNTIAKTVSKYVKEDFHKIGFLQKNFKTKKVFFENKEQFLNINTPEDYKNS